MKKEARTQRGPLVRTEVYGADEALLQIGDKTLMLDYDQAYELAFQLAHLVQKMGQRDDQVQYH